MMTLNWRRSRKYCEKKFIWKRTCTSSNIAWWNFKMNIQKQFWCTKSYITSWFVIVKYWKDAEDYQCWNRAKKERTNYWWGAKWCSVNSLSGIKECARYEYGSSLDITAEAEDVEILKRVLLKYIIWSGSAGKTPKFDDSGEVVIGESKECATPYLGNINNHVPFGASDPVQLIDTLSNLILAHNMRQIRNYHNR